MLRAGLAERRFRIGRTNLRRQPYAAHLVHPRIVDFGVAVPDRLAAPIGRGVELRAGLGGRRLGIAPFGLEESGLVVDGIEPRDEIRAGFRRTIDDAVRVQRRIAAVGGLLRPDVPFAGLDHRIRLVVGSAQRGESGRPSIDIVMGEVDR